MGQVNQASDCIWIIYQRIGLNKWTPMNRINRSNESVLNHSIKTPNWSNEPNQRPKWDKNYTRGKAAPERTTHTSNEPPASGAKPFTDGETRWIGWGKARRKPHFPYLDLPNRPRAPAAAPGLSHCLCGGRTLPFDEIFLRRNFPFDEIFLRRNFPFDEIFFRRNCLKIFDEI